MQPTPTPTPTSKPQRQRRLWRTIAATILLLGVFVFGLALAVILHANTKPVRAIVGQGLNTLIADTFYGTVRLQEVTHVSLSAVRVSRVTVRDQNGERVLVLKDVRLEIDAIGNLRRYFENTDAWILHFPHARVEQARVLLVTDPDSEAPTLSRALTPKPRPSRLGSPDAPTRQTRIWFPTIELGRVRGSLKMASLEGLEPRLVAVRGSLLISPKGVAVDVSRFGVGLLGLNVRVRGTGTVRLRAPGPLEVQFSGFAANSEVQASVKLVRNQLTASVTSPRLTSTTMRQLWPGWPLEAPLSLHAQAQGQLPHLDIELAVEGETPEATYGLAASLEPATLRSRISLDLKSDLSAEIKAELKHLSLSQFDPELPTTDIAATADGSLRLNGSKFELEASARVPATEIGSVPVPTVVARVTSDGERVNAEVTAEEPGAKTSVTVVYGLTDGVLDASFAIPSVSLDAQRRVPEGLRGKASLNGALSLRGDALNVDARAEVDAFAIGALRLGHAKIEAKTDVNPSLLEQGQARFSMHASQVALGQLTFAQAHATGTVSTEKASVKLALTDPDGRTLSASGSYHFASGELTGLQIEANRGPLRGKAKITRFDPSLPALEVEQLEVTGTECAADATCPRLHGFGRYRPGLLEGELHARSIALERLGPIFGVDLPISGQIDVHAEASVGRSGQQATLTVKAERFSVLSYNHSQVQLTAALRDSDFSGSFSALDALGIGAEGSWQAQLNGDPLNGATWEAITGTATLAVSEVSLQALPWLLDKPWLSQVEGRADVRMTLQRSRPTGFPTVFAELGISGLEASFQTSPEAEPIALPPSALFVTGTFNPEQNVLYTSASLRDDLGALLTATASMPLVPQAWLAPSGSHQASIQQSPVSLNLNLPSRSLANVPLLNESPLSGEVEAQVVVYGTVAAPQANAFVSLRDLMVPGLRRNTPVSLQSTAHYALETGDFSLELVGSSLGRSVALGKADGTIAWPPAAQAPPFQGDARLALDGLPLSLFTPLAELELAGQVTGLVELDQTTQRSLDVLLDFEEVSSGRAQIGSGTLRAAGQAGIFKSELVLQRDAQELLLTLDAFANTDGLPFPHQVRRVNAMLRMRQMNAAAFSPLLSAVVARLTGELDANVALEWERDLDAEDRSWRSHVSGIAHLRGARAYVDGLGLELQDVSVDAVATPLGRQTHLLLDRVRAKARSEDVNFEARGQLIFSGARLASGQANAVLRQVPLTLQGLNLGRATGRVSAQLDRREDWDRPGRHQGQPYLLVTATLDDWSMRASASASRSLIDTSPNPEIQVVQLVSEPTSDDALPYRIYLELGPNVRFSLADLDLPLSGRVQLDYTDKSLLYGTIQLERGGRVPIFGRVFEVENGSLRLNPNQPSNPDIDISLSGQSRDGSPVYVSLSGTLQEPIVSPPLNQLQELLGGGTATALSGGAQALGLTSVLGDNIQLRVGSDEDEQELARYSAAVQIRDNLWLEVNYQRNDTSSFSQQNDDAVSGTLDYRFNNNWSLRTEAGTTGGSVDVVWQYRY